jgi:glutathione S-transferase
MVILYENPTSSYVSEAKIALREKGIEFEVNSPDMSDGRFGGDG